jgi:hypothetical protein
MITNKPLLISLGLIMSILIACKKEAGEGGTSSIRGKVKAHHIPGPCIVDSTYYLPDERVFIIYGDEDDTYDDDMRTSFDGSYEFKYLQEGTYRIFAYSIDTTGFANCDGFDINRPIVAKIATVTIDGKNQTKDASDIVVYTWQ